MGTKHTHTVIDLESNKVPLLLALNAEGASSVVWKELVLAQGQLLTGAAGGILQAELITIITNPAVGNTFKITDGTTTETFTFRAAWGVAFDVAIGINAAATQANLVIAVNTDSTLWKAIATTSLDTWFASLPVSQVVIARKATSANNDRIFGTQTAVDGIKVVSFLASRGYEKVFSTESNIPAIDPAVKKFGFGRAFAALVTNETHLIADLDEAWTWDSDAMLWVQTGASVIHPIGGPNHSASIVTAVESKLSDIGVGAHLGLTTHSSAVNPTINNDAVDTIGLGRKFRFGDTWYNTALGYIFLCIDNTAGAAIWRQVNSQPYITTTSPGPNNDGVMTAPVPGRRFYIGDTWVNVTTQQVFYCYTNLTGAAMWVQIDNDPIAAVSNPLPTNDSVDTAVFGRVCWRGDKWLNTATGHLFECLSAAVGAAVWVQYSNQPFSSAANNPTNNNDSIDTAVLGRRFGIGDTWLNIALNTLYVCTVATPTAAIWFQLTNLPHSAAGNPLLTNDGVDTAVSGRRFRIGDTWLNTTTNNLWVCVDNTTNAAVWRTVTAHPHPAATNPLLTNDKADTAVIGRYFRIGDTWRNTSTGHVFICIDDTISAAVWVQYTNQPYSSAASNPTNNNDIVDTAVLGRRFRVGDTWLNIALGTLFVCIDSTAANAVWLQTTNQPYSAAGNPLFTNDGIDTAVAGRRFKVGDTWLNTTTNNLWICVTNTTNAAAWRTITSHPHSAASNPLLTNDKVDTAVSGRYFRIGDTWLNTATGHVYLCVDDTATAAVWIQYSNQPFSSAANNPTNNNDIVDTAVLGRRFRVGDTWLNIALGTLFVCVDSTATAAVWQATTSVPFSAAGNPAKTNDGIDTAVSGRRFKVGDVWLNTTANNLWVCVSNTTNAAEWRSLTANFHSFAVNPIPTNDKVDTAVLGKFFRVGDSWYNTATGHLFECVDDTATAAVWLQFSNQPFSSAATNPTNNNDAIDTAVLGRRFTVGDTWLNIALGTLFVCIDATATAAVWQTTTTQPFSAAGDPAKTNDAIDTAVAGRRFKVGDIWLNTVTNNLWVCAVNTAAAAAWRTITSHPYASAINPVPTNDKVDTIVLGRYFRTGDTWRNTATGHVFICLDDTATAAVWRQVSNQPYEIVGAPTVLYDSVDTAAIGRRFTVGDTIRDTLLDRIYYCSSAKVGGAKWLPVPQILTSSGLTTDILPIPVVPTVERTVYSYAHGLGGIVANAYYGASYCDTLRRVYFVPYDQAAQANWHYVDCATGNLTAYAHGAGAIGVGAYADGVYDPILNRIYLVPFNQAAQANWHYINCTTGAIVAYAHGMGAIGVGAYVGGTFDPIKNRIYFAPFAQAALATWHYIDCATGVVTAYAHGMGLLGASAYDESVYDPIKQRIYLIPYAQSALATWHYIDCATGTVVAYAHGMVDVVLNAYVNGMYDPVKQRIYMSPSGQGNQATWHYINCGTGAVVSYTHGAAGVVAGAYAGAAYDAVKNRIYFTPYAQSNQANWHYVDCIRGTIVAYKNDTVGILANAYVGATTDPAYDPVKNRIYFAPFAQADQLLWHYVGIIPSVTWHKAVINPLLTNDSVDTAGIGRRFSFNDIWCNSTTGQVFICTNPAVGAAVWTQFTNVPYSSAVNPTNNNDVVDTAVLGRRFGVGDRWLNTVTLSMYVCAASAAGAAVWEQTTNLPQIAVVDPVITNDGVDTAVLGRRFKVGDTWLNTVLNSLWTIVDVTTNAAVWITIGGYSVSGEPTGFASRATSTIAWNNGATRVEITPVAGSFDYYHNGIRYTKSAMVSAAINPAQSGLWLFYFDGGTLTALNYSLTATDYFHYCLVAAVVWNAVSGEMVSFADERHGPGMSGYTHEYLHKTIGCRYDSVIGGLTLTPPGVLPLAGTDDYHCKVQQSNGNLYDEDLMIEIAHKDVPATTDTWKQHLGLTATLTNYVVITKTVTLSTPQSFKQNQVLTFFTAAGAYIGEDTVSVDTVASNDVVLITGIGALVATNILKTYAVYPVLYRNGATGEWKQKTITKPNEQFPFIVGATPRPTWNNPAGPWTQPEATNNYYVAYWILGTNDKANPVIALMGQREDNTFNNAQDNNKYESILWGSYPFAETKLLYRLIFQCNNAYTNTVNARLREIIDYRAVSSAPVTSFIATAHSALTGLAYELASHTGFGRVPYEAAADPLVTNDDLDTAAVGSYFRNGDLWLNTGTRYMYICTNPATGAAVWRQAAPLPVPTLLNKNMVCLVTAADFNQATATVVAATPALDSYVQVLLNGVQQPVGDGVRTRNCYFSGDAGTNARAISAIAVGDTIHWVGSVAGHELAVTDVLDLNFLV